MSKTRFTKWIVLACIGTVAACTTSGEDGTVSNTELNVLVPPAGEGSPGPSVDVQTVEYTINCEGNSDTFLDDAQSFDDEVTLNGNLEVTDGQTSPTDGIPPEFGTPRPGDRAEIWQGFMDLPPGLCTIELRARDDDGEVICTAREGFTITANAIAKVNLVLVCDASFQAPVGTLDVDGTFKFTVGNFCPDLFVMNCLDSTPALPVDGVGSPTGDPAETTCEVRFRDGDDSCGSSCDPQVCIPDPADPLAGLQCSPAAIPQDQNGDPLNAAPDGVRTIVTCTGGSIDCDMDGTADTECEYNGDQLGTMFTNIGSMNVPNPATFDVLCDSGTPGAILTCTAYTTDGDADCDKTKIVEVTCPGDSPCTTYGGDAACEAAAGTVCTVDTCNEATCDGATAAACCDNTPVANSPITDCSGEDPPLAQCIDGVCEPQACETDPDCNDTLVECQVPQFCDAGTGFCCNDAGGNCPGAQPPGDQSDGTPCTDQNADPTLGGVCVGGACEPVICTAANEGTDCDDTNPCTTDTCDEGVTGGACVHTNLPNNDACSPPAGGICFVIQPDPVSQCVVANCTPGTVVADCPDTTPCSPTAVCNTAVAGGVCEYPPLAEGTTCATPVGPTCQSGACGECTAGLCVEKPVTCDTVSRNVVDCLTLEVLSIDCTIFSSGVPVPVDPVVQPSAAAFAGIELDVQPQATITLPASLTCGFSGVIPDATVFDSETDFTFGPDSVTTNSFLNDGNPDAVNSPHDAVLFDFFETCGTNCSGSPGVCTDGVTTCNVATQGVDCVALEGTGPGLVAPFFPRDPPNTVCFDDGSGGNDCPAGYDPEATGVVAITPGAPGVIPFVYEYNGVALPVNNAQAPICIGGKCNFLGFINCPPADRTGDSEANGGPTGDPGICRPVGPSQTPTDCTVNDAPRIMYDNQCNKLGAAACGGTQCAIDAHCPFNATTGQACGNVDANLCDPVNLGFCQGAIAGTCSNAAARDCFADSDCVAGGTCTAATIGACATDGGITACTADDDCPSPAGLPVCCEPYFEYNSASNVCAAGQPGTGLADTDAPTSCGSCTPLGCSGEPSNADMFTCRNGPTDGDPCGLCDAGTLTCTDNAAIACTVATQAADCGAAGTSACQADPLNPDELVKCRYTCDSCDAQSCCDVIQNRFQTATPAQYPVLPVNPAP